MRLYYADPKLFLIFNNKSFLYSIDYGVLISGYVHKYGNHNNNKFIILTKLYC